MAVFNMNTNYNLKIDFYVPEFLNFFLLLKYIHLYFAKCLKTYLSSNIFKRSWTNQGEAYKEDILKKTRVNLYNSNQ